MNFPNPGKGISDEISEQLATHIDVVFTLYLYTEVDRTVVGNIWKDLKQDVWHEVEMEVVQVIRNVVYGEV